MCTHDWKNRFSKYFEIWDVNYKMKKVLETQYKTGKDKGAYRDEL